MATAEAMDREHGGSVRDASSRAGWRKTISPTLSLLSTPWEYFVTIDQSALWQKHIAWAKPKGSDLKAYVSSQYSSRMVLLSLLLATEMSVFFNSSPFLVHLRRRLNVWGNGADNVENEVAVTGFLPFWIGFFLLLNICVTILGILATFSTWNLVSAISDSNAHSLLRSSLGEYVATLSPRLVVASLYLFFLWFLLFVIELLFGGDIGSDRDLSKQWWELLHELLTQHLHLVLLWALFMASVTALFFSIVVPLSAFGRLVLHTGAMAEPPVLSESLQMDLLPRGLHAGLVIRAHHSQRKMTAVTRQYAQRQREPHGRRPEGEPPHQNRSAATGERFSTHCISGIDTIDDTFTATAAAGGGGTASTEQSHEDVCGKRRDDGISSPVLFTETVPKDSWALSSSMAISTTSLGSNHDDDKSMIGILNMPMIQNNSTDIDRQMDSCCSADTTQPSNHFFSIQRDFEDFESDHPQDIIRIDQNGNRDLEDASKGCSDNTKKKNPLQSCSSRHRRIGTTESVASLCFPPATILNLAMTTRELHDVIDNAIDTKSQCGTTQFATNTSENNGETTMESQTNNRRCIQYDEEECHSTSNTSISAKNDVLESTEERWKPDTSQKERYSSNRKDSCSRSDISNQAKTEVQESRKSRHSGTRTDFQGGGIPLPTHCTTKPIPRSSTGGSKAIVDTATLEQKPRRHNSHNDHHQDLLTRHHRRVSSSRFLLEEWAQENRVRDLYGAAPPADLPHDIAWMRKDQHPNNDDTRCEVPGSDEHGAITNCSPANNGNISSTQASPSFWDPSRNRSQQHQHQQQESPQQYWWLSPFSSPFGDRVKISGKSTPWSFHRSRHRRSDEPIAARSTCLNDIEYGKRQEDARKPLLPDLVSIRTEETGRESSELLGEQLLGSDIDAR